MRLIQVVALMLVAALLLSACGPATPTNADEMTDSGQRFLLRLPRLEVDIDESGEPTIGGMGVGDVTGLLGMNMELNQFYKDWLAYYANWLKLTDVQHLELVHNDTGLYVFANGQLLPYVAWDEEGLSNTGTLVTALGQPAGQLVGLFAPIVVRTAANILVTFPLQDGATPIPVRDPESVPEPLEGEEAPSVLVTHIDVDYDANGVPTFAGVNSRDLAAAGLLVPIELTPDSLALLQSVGIEKFRVLSTPEGLYLSINDVPAPHIAWNGTSLQNTADLYAQMNPGSPYIELAQLIVPDLDKLDVDLVVTFPPAQ